MSNNSQIWTTAFICLFLISMAILPSLFDFTDYSKMSDYESCINQCPPIGPGRPECMRLCLPLSKDYKGVVE